MSDTYFDIVSKKTGDWLISQGYSLDSSSESGAQDKYSRYAKDDTAVQIQYSSADKMFSISRSDDGGENFNTLQVYLFDSDNGDGDSQALSIANEFIETLDVSPKSLIQSPRGYQQPAKKDSENDETGALFFVNRFPNVLPEVREPLLAHKEHYGQLLPNTFCEECVNIAVANLISDGNKEKLKKLLDFLETMYKTGDSDVKSIITVTILNSIEKEADIQTVEELLEPSLKKAWPAARKFKGKVLKPEKKTLSQKFLDSISEGNNTNSLR